MVALWRTATRVSLVALFLLVAGSAAAQPFNAWLQIPSGHGWLTASARDFTGGSFTFEAWVAVSPGANSCSSITGNNWQEAIWIGVCSGTLRSYMFGAASGSVYDAGTVVAGDWTHIAVTFDGATKTRSHYVDGELVGSRVDTSGITASGDEWRLGSDVSWEFSPVGAIDEARYWSVARTRDQIRSTITRTIDAATTGLVSVYHLDASPLDAVGPRNMFRSGTAAYLNEAITTGCTTSATQLCVGPGGRFAVSATYLTSGGERGQAKVAGLTTPESGIFWFFGANNWEVMVKVLNACAFATPRWWVFSAATTNVHYELVVTDLTHGVTKRYFNYQGVSAPAITDTGAFGTCP